MGKLSTRLANLEKLHRPAEQMLGAIEVHCIGGWGHIEGQRCEQHESCVFASTPLPGRLRRVILGKWEDGMTCLLE